MKTKTLKTIISIMMLVSLTNISFADNVIGDVPSSSNENRTIQRETTEYNWSCDISQELAFYEGSPVYLRVGQPRGQVSYVFDKTETYVRAYNESLFDGNLKFPYVSNFVPSTTIDTTDGDILTVDATGANFLGDESIARDEIAGQFVTFNNERSIIQNSNGDTLNYYYVKANDFSSHDGNLNVILNPSLTTKISCTDFYVARCGDGVIDKETGTTDGNWGITTQWGTFLSWHTTSIKPNEVCDDGDQNWQAGKCKTDCTGINGGWPICGNGIVESPEVCDDGDQNGQAGYCNSTCDGYVSAGWLVVTKILTTERPYTPGEDVQFKINFSNPTRSTITDISIEDFLPSWLEYISSEIIWATAPTYFSTGIVSWNFRIAYTWFSVGSNQNWYILINTKLISCDSALNNVYWEWISNGQSSTWYTNKQVLCSTTPVNITKTAAQSNVQQGQSVQFTIVANNSTTETINNIFIQDIWPANGCLFITGTTLANLPVEQTQNGNLTSWSLPTLAPGQNLTLTFYGQTNSSSTCLGTQTNTAKILYIDSIGNQQLQTTANITITQPTQSMAIIKNIVQEWHAPWDIVRYEIIYKNTSSTPIYNFKVIDYWPNSLDFITADPWPDNEYISPYVWTFSQTLEPGEEGIIEITGKIRSDLR